MLTPETDALLQEAARGAGLVVVLTGAGISAESGIPTFRGPEGYWTVGSKVYMPQELATRATFERLPAEVWRWYLYRLGVCWQADPNLAHRAVADLEMALEDRFVLITQNVDGLHLRAGNTPPRTYQIHGNIDLMRCSRGCTADVVQVPAALRGWGRNLEREAPPQFGSAELALLRCPRCGSWMRPHVLWFDECYDEEHYRFDSSIEAAGNADLLIIVGTSGATNLPNQVALIAAGRGSAIIAVNPEASPFTELAERGRHGAWLRGPAGRWLPPIAERLVAHSLGRPGS